MMAKLVTMCLVVFFGLLILSTSTTQGASVLHKREITTEKPSEKPTEKPSECLGNTPCGWAIYTPFTRNVSYYMQNVCTCPISKECTKIDDDISISAFVYRCRSNTKGSKDTTTTTTS